MAHSSFPYEQTYTFTPKVDEVQEFIEIANDFANPLELVREAISNSYDARANAIRINFDVEKERGEGVLVITLEDDGKGMDKNTIRAFFDLGNSTRREDAGAIGEKGHGTKVYFNSAEVMVDTVSDGHRLIAVMRDPYRKLFDREVPTVEITQSDAPEMQSRTKIVIRGYNNNRRERFTQEILRDYIHWFTKTGSFEHLFPDVDQRPLDVFLKGLNQKQPEKLIPGHPFPAESEDINSLFETHLVNAPNHYCKQIKKSGQLPNHPEIMWHAVFSIEGNRVKLDSNPMLRRQGYQAPLGAYTVQERYGLWVCKDFIPVQRMNEWITIKGSEYTRFHAFINCQELRLTANRGSVNNTPIEYLKDLEEVAKDLFDAVTNSDEWRDIEWLEEQAQGHKSTEREKKDFDYRIQRLNRSNVAEYKGHELIEPSHETGVFALALTLSTIDSTLFPFQVVDYNTHVGIDVIVKGDHRTPIYQSKLYYVEFKYFLTKELNHSFENLHSIVCWDTDVKTGDIVTDLNQQARRMHISPPERAGDYTAYFLDAPKKGLKIEVFVLKDYLKERCGIEFRPRADSETVKK
jgi:hypothetical protein